MRIALRSNFDVAGMMGADQVQLQEGATVGSLLDLLSQKCNLNLTDSKSGQINGSDFRISLNGREHAFWPQGLATRLHDADELQVLVMPLAGG